MRVVDVNILIYAHRIEAPAHAASRAWLTQARDDDHQLGLADIVLAGFLRVVTNRRAFRDPTPFDIAQEFIDGLIAGPSARRLAPGERHWSMFMDLCRLSAATGNLVTDAYIAALAIEHGATLVTADRDFLRFPGLRVENPLRL